MRAGIFVGLQRAAIAALTGPQETVAERKALYEVRRDRVVAALPTLSDETLDAGLERLRQALTPE